MTETKLDKRVKTAEFLQKNYYCVARKHRKYWGGGVMIALKSQYVADEIDLDTDGETAWVKIALAKITLCI